MSWFLFLSGVLLGILITNIQYHRKYAGHLTVGIDGDDRWNLMVDFDSEEKVRNLPTEKTVLFYVDCVTTQD